jgi:hypothetical protein
MGVAAMAIHAPAHRPGAHFHLALPHLGEAASGIVTALAILVAILLVAWVASFAFAPAAGTTAESRSIVQFRAAERAALFTEADGLVLFRAGERAPATTEAEGLVIFRAGERAPAPTEAESLVTFRAGERDSR